jgi:hypothetical protein
MGSFLFVTASRPALRPTQPHIQWVPAVLTVGIKRPEDEVDNSSHLLPGLMSGVIPPFPNTSLRLGT